MKQIRRIPRGKRVRVSNKDNRYYNQVGIIVDTKLSPEIEFEYLIELESGSSRWFKNIEVKLIGNVKIVDGRVVILPDE